MKFIHKGLREGFSQGHMTGRYVILVQNTRKTTIMSSWSCHINKISPLAFGVLPCRGISSLRDRSDAQSGSSG